MELDNVFRLLETATLLEKDGQRIEAATKYYEGCHLMRQILSAGILPSTDPAAAALLREKIHAYTLRAQRLYFDEGSVAPPITNSATTPSTVTVVTTTAGGTHNDDVSVLTAPGNPSSVRSQIHRMVGIANAKLERAVALDEETTNATHAAAVDQMVQSYVGAAEAYLAVLKLSEESSLPVPPAVARRLRACLDRAEILKLPRI